MSSYDILSPEEYKAAEAKARDLKKHLERQYLFN